jgi:hypothetical protein
MQNYQLHSGPGGWPSKTLAPLMKEKDINDYDGRFGSAFCPSNERESTMMLKVESGKKYALVEAHSYQMMMVLQPG